MRIVADQSDLRSQFKSVQAQGEFAVEAAALSKPDHVIFAEQQGVILREQAEHDQAGLKSGSVKNIHLSSAAATRDAHDAKDAKAERAAKQQAADAVFLDLLRQIDDIEIQIAFHEEQVDLLAQTIEALENGNIDIGEALGQAHVQRAIEEWQKRNPGETYDPTADNADVLLLQILEEQKRIDEAKIDGLNRDRNELVREAEETNELYRTDPELAKQEAEARVAEGYNAAEVTHAESSAAEMKEIGAGGQNSHRDEEAHSLEATADEDAFAGFDLGPADTLAANTGQLTSDFTVATVDNTDLGEQETLEYDDTLRQSQARKAKRQAAMNILGGGDPFSAAQSFRHHAFEETHRTKQARALMTPDEILAMPEDRQICFVSGKGLGPILGHKYPYYTRPEFAGRFLPNPFHPPLDRVSIPRRWGRGTARVITEPVPQKFAHLPQYDAGMWSYVQGYRPR